MMLDVAAYHATWEIWWNVMTCPGLTRLQKACMDVDCRAEAVWASKLWLQCTWAMHKLRRWLGRADAQSKLSRKAFGLYKSSGERDAGWCGKV